MPKTHAVTASTRLGETLLPVLLLPLFYRLSPLDRPALSARLLDLSRRAGVRVEFQQYANVGGSDTGEDDISVFSVGALFRF